MKQRIRILLSLIALILAISLSVCSCDILFGDFTVGNDHIPSATLDSIPEFDGETPYVIINENVPFFTEDEIVSKSYELYGELVREGFKVFFARITLEDKLGEAYEPYIFAAPSRTSSVCARI